VVLTSAHTGPGRVHRRHPDRVNPDGDPRRGLGRLASDGAAVPSVAVHQPVPDRTLAV
jgi:hypothetical protein